MVERLPSRELLPQLLHAATAMARSELIVALREPQRKLVTILRERSHSLELSEMTFEEAGMPSRNNLNWGMF